MLPSDLTNALNTELTQELHRIVYDEFIQGKTIHKIESEAFKELCAIADELYERFTVKPALAVAVPEIPNP